MTELTDLEKAMLDFEALWFKYKGTREAAIRERFDMTVTRYNQVLLRLIERPDALAYAPTTVKRLQRLRDARRAKRKARTPGN